MHSLNLIAGVLFSSTNLYSSIEPYQHWIQSCEKHKKEFGLGKLLVKWTERLTRKLHSWEKVDSTCRAVAVQKASFLKFYFTFIYLRNRGLPSAFSLLKHPQHSRLDRAKVRRQKLRCDMEPGTWTINCFLPVCTIAGGWHWKWKWDLNPTTFSMGRSYGKKHLNHSTKSLPLTLFLKSKALAR